MPAPTTPCTWTADVWPALNMPSPMMYLHVSVPAQPNTGIAVSLYPHGGYVDGTSPRIVSKTARVDETGHANFSLAITPALFETQVDIVAWMSVDTVMTFCGPNPFTMTVATPYA